MSPGTGAGREPRYGWVVVFVAFTLTALSFGGFGAVGVFLKPLAADFGWSRGAVSAGYTAMSLATAAFGVLWGMISDRIGSRRLAVMGAAMMGVGLLLLSRQQALWQFYAFYAVFGAFGAAAVGGPMFANVGFWFSRNKGLALGVTAAGGAFGQAVAPFAARLLISDYDWQTAYWAIGLAYLAIGLPLALLVRDPEARIAARGGNAPVANDVVFALTPRETVTWISVAVIFCCICMATPVVHVVPLISDRGIDPETAASVLTVLMIAGIGGRIFAGWLGDRIGGLETYMAMSLIQTVLVIWFPHVGAMPAVYVLAAMFGFAYSGVMASILVTLRMTVPARVSATAMSVGTLFGWIGMGLGAYQGGLFFDLTGGYFWSYTNAGIAGIVNLMILTAFYLRIRRKSAALVAA